MRVEALERADAEVRYRIVDGWFDAKACESRIVRETTAAPRSLLGGLMLAMRARCESCTVEDRLVVLMPPLMAASAHGLGGDAVVSQGPFTLVELPLRKGGAAAFTGVAAGGALEPWTRVLGLDVSGVDPTTEVHLGVEVQQAVPDAEPLGIVYATVVRRT
jgi:hypothetical protein